MPPHKGEAKMTPNADVFLQDQDGNRHGPFKGTLTPTFFTTKDPKIDVVEGNHIVRTLPNGREEMYLVREANFYERGAFGSQWQLKLTRTTVIPKAIGVAGTTFNIHNSQGIQVGDHNMMQFQSSIDKIISEIDAAIGSQQEKEAAKSLLQKFLAHPLVVSLAGGAARTML